MASKKENAKWMARLLKADTAVRRDYNPFMHGLRFSSPGLNFLFGNTQCLPRGYPIIVWGKNKSGKTVMWYDLVGQMHRDDPDGFAMRFDCEFKEEGQLTDRMMRSYGIEPDRYIAHMTNDPEKIFDYIEKEVDAMCQDGFPLRAICIDPLSTIMGRRQKNAEGVATQQRGDRAATLQEGLSRIWPVIHKHRIALYLTTHARAEQDPVEQMRGKSIRMEAAWFVKHFGGYVIKVEANEGKAGRQDIAGNVHEDKTMAGSILPGAEGKLMNTKGERVAHKVRATMEGNSFGPKNRQIEFTFDDVNGGLINQWEEVFLLGVGRGIITRPNATTYVFPNWPAQGEEMSWKGKDNFFMALRDNADLRKEIVTRLREQDVSIMELGTQSPYWKSEENVDKQELGNE